MLFSFSIKYSVVVHFGFSERERERERYDGGDVFRDGRIIPSLLSFPVFGY